MKKRKRRSRRKKKSGQSLTRRKGKPWGEDKDEISGYRRREQMRKRTSMRIKKIRRKERKKKT